MKKFINQAQMTIRNKASKRAKTLEYKSQYGDPNPMSRKEIIDKYRLLDYIYIDYSIEECIDDIYEMNKISGFKLIGLDQYRYNKVNSLSIISSNLDNQVTPLICFRWIPSHKIHTLQNKIDEEKFMREG